MSKGQYDTVKYLGQELHLALKRLFIQKQCSQITINHRDYENVSQSVLSYCVSGFEVQMQLLKNELGYHLNTQVGIKGSNNLETRADRDLDLKRSKDGRVSHVCMDSIALESLKYLREFAKTPRQ